MRGPFLFLAFALWIIFAQVRAETPLLPVDVALVLAAFWGWAIWGELPGLSSGLGILLILASGVFVAWRASRHRAVTSP